MKRYVFAICLISAQSATAHADNFGSGANSFNIDFVTIGNPGNPADTEVQTNTQSLRYLTSGYGSVDYTYRMGTYEISEQMVAKANALGGLAITMDVRGNDKPATSISWNEAARFVNWLNTSTGSPPAYKFATQPGAAGYSANAEIQLWDPGDAGYNASNRYRNSIARYFLPGAHEWYKAAYYDPAAGVYRDYPTGSDSVPDGTDFVGDPLFDAVFDESGLNNEAHDITNVGVFSPYGTAGQGGNVDEWEESDDDMVNDNSLYFSNRWRGVRGGSWDAASFTLHASYPISGVSWGEFGMVGFRVASSAVPEPSSLPLAVLAGPGLLFRRARHASCPYTGDAATLHLRVIARPGTSCVTPFFLG